MKREDRKVILDRLHDLRRRLGPLMMAPEAPRASNFQALASAVAELTVWVITILDSEDER